jgi:uncharacterized protein (DUF362 family)
MYQGEALSCLVQSIFKDFPVDKSRVKRVSIKPNLCNYKTPETGSTTDVKLIREICRALFSIRSDMDISIVESDGSNVNADLALKLLGYCKLEKELNVKLVNLTQGSKRTIYPEGLSYFKRFEFPTVFDRTDFFISVPKLKTMSEYGITCALKNQFGCNPARKKMRYHQHLEEVVSDLNKIFKPGLIVVDGLVAMEGRGPAGGSPKKMGILVAGDDPVAVDYVCCELIGIDPKKISQITFSKKAGTGTLDNVEIIRGDIEKYKSKFRNPCSIRGRLLNFSAKLGKRVGAEGVL